MSDKLTKKEKIGTVIAIGILISLVLFYLFVFIPFEEEQRLKEFNENQKTKIGKIILVVPEKSGLRGDEGNIYFEDGSIMGKWQREDYNEFRKYINKEVKIVYGEIRMCDDCSVDERMLFSIEEV